MGLKILPTNSRALLKEIVSTENPVALLNKKLDTASPLQKKQLKQILCELKEKGYINIQWANNKPYRIEINNSARTYEEQLADCKKGQQAFEVQSITIGNNNRIKNSTIAGKMNMSDMPKTKGFYDKHPVLCGVLISLGVGIVLLFSFWARIIAFIEELFL